MKIASAPRSSLSRLVLALLLLLPLVTRAQGSDTPDAGSPYDLPDASVDMGVLEPEDTLAVVGRVLAARRRCQEER